ncbi:thiopurine S-methyltransferase [Psychrobacter urativorans]|uniref:Thiopurine S-methyltransferase n=1 Tax=Psychrobacter urativorans TaxID=45610 RepID=A0A0M4TUX5_9GAMM|nr:thiopurine S-methyltransferase [Psychrobacter urativorans]ALF59536.1 thiopurine S-methyltransferase [Psychrobacter urativorans]
MNPEFWQARWQEKRIGFNQPDVNPLLIKYFKALNLPIGSRVFVPLCGKSIDMVWLATQGYDVVGVELVETAVQEFFTEQAIPYTVIEDANKPNIKCYTGEIADRSIALWVADIFALSADDMGHIDAVYDRAALIAMPPEMRPKYSEQVRKLSNNASQLLLTLNYDQNEWAGPPFSISSEQVQQYYSSQYQITELEGEPSTLNAAPEMAVREYVWLLLGK